MNNSELIGLLHVIRNTASLGSTADSELALVLNRIANEATRAIEEYERANIAYDVAVRAQHYRGGEEV